MSKSNIFLGHLTWIDFFICDLYDFVNAVYTAINSKYLIIFIFWNKEDGISELYPELEEYF